jgi:hypothetical protein
MSATEARNSERRAICVAATGVREARRGVLFQNVRAPPDIVCGSAGDEN